MNTLLAAAPAPEGAGAPLADIALVGGIISAATLVLLALVVRYRAGGARLLRLGGSLTERFLGVPGWAALPGLGAIGAATVTFMGAIWDIGVHIDDGRDTGPFGTTAHYPLLAGLVATYLLGLLAVGMAPKRERAPGVASLTLPGLGPVPIGALLILTGGGYAMLGFPLDDLWHRVFGQDVTLWGPTHTMFFGGLITASVGAVILMAQGARAAGHEPFGRWSLVRRPLPGLVGGIFLFLAVHATDEFNWAVPQYRQVWQPLLLMFFGAFALVLARALGGRGATVAALAAYLPLQLIEVALIGQLDTTQPASVLFIAEAALVEAVWWRAAGGRTVRTGLLAGLAVGTVGFAAEWGWSHLAMPLPWRAALLPEAVPTAALAGMCGGVLAVLMSQALTGGLERGRRPLGVALAASAVVLGLCVNAGIASSPAGLTATLTLTNTRTATVEGGPDVPGPVADLQVRLSDPGLGRDGNWAYALGWQGDGRYAADLVLQPDGSLRSSTPVPVGGTWKTFVRIHKGRTQVAVPVRMPADPPLDFAGFEALPQVTRPMIGDAQLMQIERKEDGPTWAWTPAMLLVMAMNLGLMALVAAGAVRVGRGVVPREDEDDPTGVVRRPRVAPASAAPRRRLVGVSAMLGRG